MSIKQIQSALQAAGIGNVDYSAAISTLQTDVAGLLADIALLEADTILLENKDIVLTAKINTLIEKTQNVRVLSVTANTSVAIPAAKAIAAIVVQKTNSPALGSQTISGLVFGRTSGANNVLNSGNTTIGAGLEAIVLNIGNSTTAFSSAASNLFIGANNWNGGTFNFFLILRDTTHVSDLS